MVIEEGRPARLDPPPEVSSGAVPSALSDPDNLCPDGERCLTCHATIQDCFCLVGTEKRPSAQPKSVVGFLHTATMPYLFLTILLVYRVVLFFTEFYTV